LLGNAFRASKSVLSGINKCRGLVPSRLVDAEAGCSVAAAAFASTSASAGNVSSGAEVVLNLSSGSRLGGTLTVLGSAVLGLGLVVVGLGDGDGTGDVESSLGDLALLGLSITVALGLADLSLVGHGVLVGDDDLLSADLGLGTSGLRGELGVSTSSVGTGERGIEGSTTTVGGTGTVVSTILARAGDLADGLGLAARITVDTLKGSSRDGTDESKDSEFHLFLNVLDY
jgi:hypothetical protein